MRIKNVNKKVVTFVLVGWLIEGRTTKAYTNYGFNSRMLVSLVIYICNLRDMYISYNLYV